MAALELASGEAVAQEEGVVTQKSRLPCLALWEPPAPSLLLEAGGFNRLSRDVVNHTIPFAAH